MTFDSGGLSLKPSDGMLTMKCDMAGAATMLGAMRPIALLKLPVNVVGLAGLVENMTGPAAMKLGDVLTARSGTTIEVHNTDAEGRLVLADVLNVAVETGATKIVDLATLTGACVVALGTEVAGLMTNDQPWCDAVAAAARACGEAGLAIADVSGVRRPDQRRSGRHQERRRRPLGRGDHGRQVPGTVRRQEALDPHGHRRPGVRDKPKPWSDGGASGSTCGRWSNWPAQRLWSNVASGRRGLFAALDRSVACTVRDSYSRPLTEPFACPGFPNCADEIGWHEARTLDARNRGQGAAAVCARPRRVLLLPPDITRMHSGAGRLTEMLYHLSPSEGPTST